MKATFGGLFGLGFIKSRLREAVQCVRGGGVIAVSLPSPITHWRRCGGGVLSACGDTARDKFGRDFENKFNDALQPTPDSVTKSKTAMQSAFCINQFRFGDFGVKTFAAWFLYVVGKSFHFGDFGNKTFAAILATVISFPVVAAEVNLYTDRQEIFLREVAAEYERQSGDKINTLFVKKGLLQRAQAEGDLSPADVFLITDIGRLTDFVDAGLTAPTTAPVLQNIAADLRDANNHWFAVTRRARIMFAAPGAVIPSYAALATPQYRGAVCLRSGAHPYNNALFADLIGRLGEQRAAEWMRKIKNNLARLPQGNDRAQINAVANGECKIGIANSYYYFHLLNNAAEDKRQKLRLHVAPIFPHKPHINITGMARARHAPNPQAAIRLMEFLAGKQAQEMLAAQNLEFPIRADATYPPSLRPHKNAIENTAPRLLQTAKWRKKASEIADQIGFDR